MPTPTCLILGVEDDALLLDFLVLRLGRVMPSGTVIEQASTGAHALRLARERRPDLVILDLGLPDMSGFQVAAELAALRPAPRVLILTSSTPDNVLNRIPGSPIHGLLLKSSTRDDELARALKEIWSGRTYFQPPVLAAIAAARSQPDHFSKILSDREVELLPLFGFGWVNEKIGHHSQLSPATVRTHLQNILLKLNLHSREELMTWAMKKGFVDFRYEPQPSAPAVAVPTTTNPPSAIPRGGR
jgi:two-component system response regulator NreC